MPRRGTRSGPLCPYTVEALDRNRCAAAVSPPAALPVAASPAGEPLIGMIETDTPSPAAAARGVARPGAALSEPPARGRAVRRGPFLPPIVCLGALASRGLRFAA